MTKPTCTWYHPHQSWPLRSTTKSQNLKTEGDYKYYHLRDTYRTLHALPWADYGGRFAGSAIGTRGTSISPGKAEWATVVETATGSTLVATQWRGSHRLNTAVVLAVVHGLLGLSRVGARGRATHSLPPPSPIPPPPPHFPAPNEPPRFCGCKATCLLTWHWQDPVCFTLGRIWRSVWW